jgi:hypothetical protein
MSETKTAKSAQTHKCRFCDFTTNHRGKLNFHEKDCELKLLRSKVGTKEEKQELECDCKDGGQWRLLKKEVQIEAYWIDRGATKVCEKCEEVG